MFGMSRHETDNGQLANALSDVVRAVQDLTKQKKTEFEWLKSHFEFATKQDLKEMENKIMSAISDFAAKQKAFNDRQGKAIDSAVESVSGLTGDVAELNRLIKQLQDSPGTITPEDQATLNELETQGEAAATKAEGVATALTALDSQTPPVVPPTP